MNSIILLSPAKINLIFEILGTRKDGYHEIRSLVQPIDLFDEVKIDLNEGTGISLHTSGIELTEAEDNIAWRAANEFLKKSGLRRSVTVSINKKIPIGAGLGGGSSNAAAVLVGLNKLTESLKHEELMEICPGLGADVAVFMRCTTSYTEGIGEQVTPIQDFPLLNYIVIYPRFRVSTEKVFKKWDTLKQENKRASLLDENKYRLFTGFQTAENQFPLYNALEQATFELYPRVKHYKNLLRSCGAESVLMTGSGSAVYAVFKQEESATEIYDYLESAGDFDVFKAKGIHGWHRLVT